MMSSRQNRRSDAAGWTYPPFNADCAAARPGGTAPRTIPLGMVRRSILPMIHAARRLPWQVELSQPAGGLGHDLNLLLAWCRARYAPELWFWPGPRGLWCFAAKPLAEAFAAEASRLLGRPASLRDSRGTKAPPWASKS